MYIYICIYIYIYIYRERERERERERLLTDNVGDTTICSYICVSGIDG